MEDLNALALYAGLELDYGSAVYVEIGVRLENLYVLASSADLAALASSHVVDVEMVVSLDMLYVPANSPDLERQSCAVAAA